MANDSDTNTLLHEPWISLAQAAGLFPPARLNRPVSGGCVWRWATTGVVMHDGRCVRLETLRVVNRLVTSVPAVHRFILAQQPADAGGPVATPTHTERPQ